MPHILLIVMVSGYIIGLYISKTYQSIYGGVTNNLAVVVANIFGIYDCFCNIELFYHSFEINYDLTYIHTIY